MGGEREILPILTARLLKKSTMLVLTGSIVNSAKFSNDPFLRSIKILNMMTCNLVSKIILYSPHVIGELGLENHKNKILFAYEHYLDFNKFYVRIQYKKRSPIIGYAGRLSGEKGVYNFVQSLPIILEKFKNVQVIIGGDGLLKEEIKKYLERTGLSERVTLLGWVSHDNLPEFMNRLQILIIPSYTEGGGPFVMLEAMACGTPVLATPVGVIPDVIKDGDTGFIMENNSPECIAKNVNRALSRSDLERVALNGRTFVEKNYSFESTFSRWKNILEKI
jgi:glycosyltransferase involved in cell wall biosynthesis